MNDSELSTVNRLSREPGSYALALRLPEQAFIRVGRLGPIGFASGWYAYTGSAFGPGGLAGRISHHLRPVRRPHWHIDYLRAKAKVMKVWIAAGTTSREHAWASVLAEPPLAGIGVPGFGCSDCRCRSHLLYFAHLPRTDLILKHLEAEEVPLSPAPISTGPGCLK